MTSDDWEPFLTDASRLGQAIVGMRQRLDAQVDGATAQVLDDWAVTLEAVEAAYAEIVDRSAQHAQAMASAARRKDEILAMVGHELRNPLSTITTGLEVLRQQAHTAALLAKDRTFRIVREQAGHMGRLLDELLQTRCDAAMHLAGSLALVSVGALAEQAVLAVEARVRARNQRLTLELPPREIQVRVDEGRLAQVLVNLLDNASKYTEDGGSLGLRVEADERMCVIRVWDEGIGVPGEEVERMLAMFTQGQRLPGRAPSGMGIGLGLAARIVELHGGQLEILSRDQGRPCGTEVVVRLDRHRVGDVDRRGRPVAHREG